MTPENKINSAIEKACDFLITKQSQDGSWTSEKTDVKEPQIYQKELVLTSQCAQTLLYSQNQKYVDNIDKSINFCLNSSLEEKDPIDWFVWKLIALKYSNTNFCRQNIDYLAQQIAKRQVKGYWVSFPVTSNILNRLAVFSIKDLGFENTLKNALSFFKKNKAKDNVGWGFSVNDEKTQPSFTANVITAMLDCGEDPLCKEIQDALLIFDQRKVDKGWPSSEMTISKEPTMYGTAIALQSLIRASGNPLSKEIEDGIKFLLAHQLKDGGWGLSVNDKDTRYYITYYVIQTLALYNFIKENWSKPEIELLKKEVKPQHITAMLYNSFCKSIKERYHKSAVTNILSSRILGSTMDAVDRRKRILDILNNFPPLGVAEIIDELKKEPRYAELSKKSHMTQIKSDVDYLKALNLIREDDNFRYYSVHNLLD